MTAYRYIILGFSIIGVIVWILWLIKNKKHWGYSVAPISYFLHTIALYIFVIFSSLTPVQLNNWSNAVRLHGIFLCIGLGIMLLISEGAPWNHQS